MAAVPSDQPHPEKRARILRPPTPSYQYIMTRLHRLDLAHPKPLSLSFGAPPWTMKSDGAWWGPARLDSALTPRIIRADWGEERVMSLRERDELRGKLDCS